MKGVCYNNDFRGIGIEGSPSILILMEVRRLPILSERKIWEGTWALLCSIGLVMRGLVRKPPWHTDFVKRPLV